MSGIFITKGMRLRVPPGGPLAPDADGNLSEPSLVLHVHYDVCPTWFELAIGHLKRAHTARVERDAVWGGTDEEAKRIALESEFSAGMQAIVAASIAIDAFYAAIKSECGVDEATAQVWREKKTPRPAQISDVIRRGFHLKDQISGVVRGNLVEIFEWRDYAVHPAGTPRDAIMHPELNVGTEWRFVYFRFTNAEKCVGVALRMVWELVGFKKLEQELQLYVDGLRGMLEPVLKSWPEHFMKIVTA